MAATDDLWTVAVKGEMFGFNHGWMKEPRRLIRAGPGIKSSKAATARIAATVAKTPPLNQQRQTAPRISVWTKEQTCKRGQTAVVGR